MSIFSKLNNRTVSQNQAYIRNLRKKCYDRSMEVNLQKIMTDIPTDARTDTDGQTDSQRSFTSPMIYLPVIEVEWKLFHYPFVNFIQSQTSIRTEMSYISVCNNPLTFTSFSVEQYNQITKHEIERSPMSLTFLSFTQFQGQQRLYRGRIIDKTSLVLIFSPKCSNLFVHLDDIAIVMSAIYEQGGFLNIQVREFIIAFFQFSLMYNVYFLIYVL